MVGEEPTGAKDESAEMFEAPTETSESSESAVSDALLRKPEDFTEAEIAIMNLIVKIKNCNDLAANQGQRRDQIPSDDAYKGAREDSIIFNARVGDALERGEQLRRELEELQSAARHG